jgi:putative glutamine amidotransferase
MIPSGMTIDTLRAIYERVDAVLIPGGGDINPARYGATPHEKTDRIDDARDSAEIMVTRWAYEEDRPLFGICRGNQLVNVALGGTLVQDIPSLIATDIIHSNPPSEPERLIHDVRIRSDSLLARVTGADRLTVNSLHHQSIEHPAPGLAISAHADDDIIEAVEAADRFFFLSVQWHPEDLVADDPIMERLFAALVDAARDWRTKQRPTMTA